MAPPATWVGWASAGILIVASLGIFARRFTGGFRGIFVGWILAGAFALVAILWKQERSILVWLPAVIGILAAIWAGAEILLPH